VLKALGLAGGMTAPQPQQAAQTLQIPQQAALAAATPQTTPAGTPPPAPATSAAPSPQGFGGKVEGFLENPLLQGALGAYLGTIGSPRRGGWGRALANGGITGLNAFNQAEEEKGKQPMEAAKLAESEAGTHKDLAIAALNEARQEQLKGDPQANAKLGQALSIIANDPATSPSRKQIISILLPGVQAGKIGADKVATALSSESVDEARATASLAAAGKSQADTSLVPERKKEIEAHVGELGTASKKNLAETGKAVAETGQVGKSKAGAAGINPTTVTKIYQSEYDKARTTYIASHKATGVAGMFADPNKLQADADAYAKEQADAAVAKLQAAPAGGATLVRGTHNGVSGTFDPSTNTFTPDA